MLVKTGTGNCVTRYLLFSCLILSQSSNQGAKNPQPPHQKPCDLWDQSHNMNNKCQRENTQREHLINNPHAENYSPSKYMQTNTFKENQDQLMKNSLIIKGVKLSGPDSEHVIPTDEQLLT